MERYIFASIVYFSLICAQKNFAPVSDLSSKPKTIICFFLLVALLPDKPLNLTVTNVMSRRAELSWKDPENTGDGILTEFWIQLKTGNSSIQNITTDKVNKYQIVNLKPYTTYEIFVAAGNKYGFGEGSFSSFTTSEEGEIARIKARSVVFLIVGLR